MAGQGGTFVRREVWSLPANDLTLSAYAKAVAAMRKRPASDPTSWAYQAAIHGSEASSPQPLWNQCKHGTWYFVAWHRMFVYFFEQIVRAAVIETGGPSDWALPYWNYGLSGQNATLPLAFRGPTEGGTPNPLFVAQRAPGINSGSALPPAVTADVHALSRPSFTGAAEFGGGVEPPNQQFWSETGRLEQTPHNDIHNAVGGQGGWMANPDEAAQDPIFWLHHTNIDRIWAVWSAQGRTDPSDKRWTEQRFEFFDTNGQKVSKTCADVLDTVVDLGYTYDPPPMSQAPSMPSAIGRPQAAVPPLTPPEPRVVGATAETVTLVGNLIRVPLEVDARARDEVLASIGGANAPRVFLNIEDIEGDVNPGSVYGIYVNLPEQASAEQLAAHHVGNVSFFGIERARNPRDDEHAHNLRVSVEITDFVQALRESGNWDDQQLFVTFRPLELIPPQSPTEAVAPRAEPTGEDPPVHIGRVSLSFG